MTAAGPLTAEQAREKYLEYHRKYNQSPKGRARDALSRLGYGTVPPCLPGEDEECGATYAQHTVAYLATINAVCDHQLAHLGPAYSEAECRIYLHECAELERRCEDGHGPGPLPAS